MKIAALVLMLASSAFAQKVALRKPTKETIDCAKTAEVDAKACLARSEDASDFALASESDPAIKSKIYQVAIDKTSACLHANNESLRACGAISEEAYFRQESMLLCRDVAFLRDRSCAREATTEATLGFCREKIDAALKKCDAVR